MLMVPEYKTRLRSLHFKTTLPERTEEMKVAYDYIYKASVELKTSKKLAKILEVKQTTTTPRLSHCFHEDSSQFTDDIFSFHVQFVLAMGNYLNNGQPKSHRTTSFKINFLTEVRTAAPLVFSVSGHSARLIFSFLLAAQHDQNSGRQIHLPAHSGQVSVPTLPRAAQLLQRPDNGAAGRQGYGDVTAAFRRSLRCPGSRLLLICPVNQRAVTAELGDLHSTIQDIRTACLKIPLTSEDHFASVMSVR